MAEYNCSDRCGICCIICTFIPLTEDEADSYMSVFRKDKPEKKQVKLTMKYIPDLNRKRKVCFYFDPCKKECTIYNERPGTCREWNCKSEDFSKEYAVVMEQWNMVKEMEQRK